MKPNTQQLNDLTIQVRRDILRMVHAVIQDILEDH